MTTVPLAHLRRATQAAVDHLGLSAEALAAKLGLPVKCVLAALNGTASAVDAMGVGGALLLHYRSPLAWRDADELSVFVNHCASSELSRRWTQLTTEQRDKLREVIG